MNFIKSLIVFLLCTATLACTTDHSKPGYEIKLLNDMMRPVTYEAYSKNPVFKNGITMQEPVPNTIHKNTVLDYTPLNTQPTPENMLQGKHLFRNYCMVCHGVFGKGDGPIIPKFPNPPSFTSERVKALSNTDIYNVITKGKGNMPSHASQIEVADRWKIIQYIKGELQND